MSKQETVLDIAIRNTWNGMTSSLQRTLLALCGDYEESNTFGPGMIQVECDEQGLDFEDFLIGVSRLNELGFRALESITTNEKGINNYSLYPQFMGFVRGKQGENDRA